MFPGANARIYYNDAGEPLGWDYPPDPDPYAVYDYDYDGDLPDDDGENPSEHGGYPDEHDGEYGDPATFVERVSGRHYEIVARLLADPLREACATCGARIALIELTDGDGRWTGELLWVHVERVPYEPEPGFDPRHDPEPLCDGDGPL